MAAVILACGGRALGINGCVSFIPMNEIGLLVNLDEPLLPGMCKGHIFLCFDGFLDSLFPAHVRPCRRRNPCSLVSKI